MSFERFEQMRLVVPKIPCGKSRSSLYLQPSRPWVPPLHLALSLSWPAVIGGEYVCCFFRSKEVLVYVKEIIPGGLVFVIVVTKYAFNPMLMKGFVYLSWL